MFTEFIPILASTLQAHITVSTQIYCKPSSCFCSPAYSAHLY